MTGFPYSLIEEPSPAGRLGLIVLQVDETIEGDFRRLFPDPALTLHITRIPSGTELTPETIAGMAEGLPRATALLPQVPMFDAVGYACTSGTLLLGPERVEDLVRRNCRTRRVCTPLTAAVEAFRHLGIARLGLVSPYIASVSEPLREAFVASGVEVPNVVSFDESTEANVARIDGRSLMAATRAVADGVDAVFLSCTNLRTFEIIAPLEAELGVPVLSSNSVFGWAMARDLPTWSRPHGPGRLFGS
ncbi:aspartate/glutamate racemase family protein [Pelagovum pacificum]|uniref:Asp/Glu racemase n=1 Tax=Pelagovum pacificum TaxID=2588711 RepID=A0A5C5G7V6_9RHOB|nr:aspartate/glutamate racemase family protein [Pelagovum pacificum]QQA41563.1 Asp/Glu racemase [Pelagovum pacificum]TNY30843.1 Asp/Glu racemase [Pelagovum pacificum]